MENKTAAILVLAIAASMIVTASAAYAMGRQTTSTGSYASGTNFGYGMGRSMMGGLGNYQGGMMGGYGGYHGGMMGAWNGTYPMYQYMQQEHARYCWNTTAAP